MGEQAYLSAILDLGDHSIVSYVLGQSNNNNQLWGRISDLFILPSSVIKSHNSAKQVIELLQESICTKAWNILMLHSILTPSDEGYGKDPWYWDAGEFRKLCQWLSINGKSNISVVTINEGRKALGAKDTAN